MTDREPYEQADHSLGLDYDGPHGRVDEGEHDGYATDAGARLCPARRAIPTDQVAAGVRASHARLCSSRSTS